MHLLRFYPQISLVRSKFIEALQNYQQVEQQYRLRYRQRVERQFKIGRSLKLCAACSVLSIAPWAR